MTSASLITLLFMVVFFAIMLWIGLRSRKHASDINGFVLGSRQVGPWLSAFAYGTSYFSAVIFAGFSSRFAWAAAFFSTAKARMISSGMGSLPAPIGKLFRLRSVWAPQYLSAGTFTSPMESCSVL